MKKARMDIDISALIDWEFQLFNRILVYRDDEDFSPTLSTFISAKQFWLLSKVMSEEQAEFTDDELFEIFSLGDKFLAAGKSKARIFSILIRCTSSRPVGIPQTLQYLELWKEFEKFLGNSEWAVQLDGNSIHFDGLKVLPSKKQENLVLLKNLSTLYSALFIKCIPLNAEDLPIIRSFSCSLTELHFMSCPFNFDEPLDLSNFTALTHFTCNCSFHPFYLTNFADNHLPFIFKSFRVNLEYLDISGNWINPIDYPALISFLESQRTLKFLDLSDNRFSPFSALNLLQTLFSLPLLEYVGLSDNTIGAQFCRQLCNFPRVLHWKSLKLARTKIAEKDLEIFSKALQKLKNLVRLNIEGNFAVPSSLWGQIAELPALGILELDYREGERDLNEIHDLFIKNENLQLNISSLGTISSCDNLEFALNPGRHDKICALMENENLSDVSHINLGRIILDFKPTKTYEPSVLESTIGKIKNTNSVCIMDVPEKFYKQTEILFQNNSIKEFKYENNDETKPKYKLYQLMDYCRPTSLSISSWSDKNHELIDYMLERNNENHWIELEYLCLENLSIDLIFKILNDINLPNLKTLILSDLLPIPRESKFIRLNNKIPSLQTLEISQLNENYFNFEYLNQFLKCFPYVVKLCLRLPDSTLNYISISTFPNGLRQLEINVDRIENLRLFSKLPQLQFLIDLKYDSYWGTGHSENFDQALDFPNLICLTTNKWVLDHTTLHLPSLRALVVSNSYAFPFSYLRQFPKLKFLKLNFIFALHLQEVFESDFFCSFPNLNAIVGNVERDDESNFREFEHKSSETCNSLMELTLYNYPHENILSILKGNRFPYLSEFNRETIQE